MLQFLKNVENCLPQLLFDKAKNGEIRTMYIDDYKPFVSRIWFPVEDKRVFLHKIQPCKPNIEALWHYHPWESAIKIIHGEYEMGIGHSETNETPKTIDCKLLLTENCRYEMLEPDGWHYVAPSNYSVYSLMVTGKLFEGKKMDLKRKELFRKLTKIEILEILFQAIDYNPWYKDFNISGHDIVDLVVGK